MSTNNAPGEVENNINFDSPNIDPAELESEQEEMTEEQKIQKQRETVDIDGVPLSEEEIAFKASDIKKKGRMNYFVNIEGAEERARAAARKEAADKAAIERASRNAAAAAEKERRAEEDEANKKLIEEKRRTEEVKKYLKRQDSEHKREKKKIFNEKNRETIRKRRNTILKFGGIGVAVVAIIAIVVTIIIVQANEAERIRREEQAEAESSKAIAEDSYTQTTLELDTNDNLVNYFENYEFDRIDEYYDNAVYEIDNDVDKGRLYVDKMHRLLENCPEEYERILAAAERAYIYAPEDPEVASNVAFAYDYVGQHEKAQSIRDIVAELQRQKYDQQHDENEEDSEVEHAG